LKFAHWQYLGAMIGAGLEIVVPLITRAADSPPSAADTLEEVIVTAERRVERAMDVPASISVISAAEIERLHATNLRDLEAAAPGFTIKPSGSAGQGEIVVRGLPTLAGGSAVATLIDDASVGSSTSSADGPGFALDMLPYDIERIEILRGPQGTLYGANSMSGVLKYVTKDPSLTAHQAQIGAEVFGIKDGGSLGTGVRGTWSAPLIEDELALRASLYDQESPGYIKNPWRGVNHENTLSQYGGRLAMLWQPAPELQVRLQGIYQRYRSAGDAIIFAQVLGTAQDPYYIPGNWIYGDLTYPHLIPEPFSSELTFVSATLAWHTAFGDLVAVSSYSDKGESQSQDWTGIFLDPSIPTRLRFIAGAKKASQELRFASRSGQRLEWVAGAYYTHERAWQDSYIDALDAQLNPDPALNPYGESHYPSTYSEAAVFGTLTYRVSDKFDLTGGLRWLTNRQKVDQYIPPNYQFPGAVGHTQIQSAETARTYTFSARFRPRPETMTYVRVASGYRPGTPNPPLPGYPEITPLAKSDTMVSYEMGVKSELMNRKATLALDVFKENWTDMQIFVPTADSRVFYTVNVGAVTSEGCEFEAAYRPIDTLHVAVNAGYADAYATQAVPAVGIFVGTRLPSSPKWTAAAMLDYRLRDLDNWTPQFSVAWRFVSSQYTALSTTPPVGLVPAYSLVNVDLRMTRGRYEVALYAKNLIDKRTFDNGGAGPGPNYQGFVFGGFTVEPRVVGLSATLTL
jgi:outer membrane receptor protein involved in Fe transport